jgi:dienelactone hydrolase
MDIFGLAPQTIQGADLLAAALDALVILPDFFRGEPAQGEWFAGGEENDKKKAAFMARVQSSFGANVKELLAVVDEGRKKWPSLQSWGANGLCWGGKVRFATSHVTLRPRKMSLCWKLTLAADRGIGIWRRYTFQSHRSSSPWVCIRSIRAICQCLT